MDHQYRENGREIYTQTIIRWELTLYALQINQKNFTLSTNHRAIDEILRIPEYCWPFLYLNFTGVLQFSSDSPGL